MSESRFDFWMRQTLREKSASVLTDWKEERNQLFEENETLKAALVEASETIDFYASKYIWWWGVDDSSKIENVIDECDVDYNDDFVAGKHARKWQAKHKELIDKLKEKKMIFTEEQRESFTDASKPLIKWLNENSPSPHVEVTVTQTEAEYKEGKCRISTMEFVKD